MSDIGCWITPDRGVTYYNLNSGGARALTFLQRIQSLPGTGTATHTISNKAPNSTLFVIPLQGGKIYQTPTSAVPKAMAITGIGINGNIVTVNYNTNLPDGWGSVEGNRYFEIDVYQTIDAGDNYGLYFLNDITSFTGITDAFTSGLCVYRTTVSVNGEWAVPTNVEGYANCTVGATWDHGSAVVEFNNARKVVTVTGGPVTLNIAVFSNGFNLRMPDYGIFIYNSNNVCTFNSNYIPYFRKGQVTLTDGAQSTGLARPMVSLCVAGVDFDFINNNTIRLFNRGIILSGGTIRSARGKFITEFYVGNYGVSFPKSSIPVTLMDGSQYF